MSGTYVGEILDFVSDAACEDPWGLDVASLEEANATEVLVAEDGDSMTFDDAVDCELDDRDFDCLGVDEERVGATRLATSVVVTGRWDTPFAFESDWSLETSCEGTRCGDLEVPCTASWTFDPRLYEE